MALSKTITQCNKYSVDVVQMHQVFNKQFKHIEEICDTDISFEATAAPQNLVDQVIFKTLRTQNMKPLKLFE